MNTSLNSDGCAAWLRSVRATLLVMTGGMALAVALPAAAAPVVRSAAVMASAPAAAPGPLEQQLSAGFVALQRGDLAAAEKALTPLLKDDHGRVRALLGLAEVALKRGQPAQAEAHLKSALTEAPNNADVLVAYGRFHSASGHFDAALALLREAVAAQPAHYAAQRDLGDLLLNGFKRPDEAIAAYKKAIEAKPDAVPPRVGIALAHLAAGRKAAAVAQLEDAARLAPKDPVLPHLMGRILAADKQFAPALQALDRALAIQPKFVAAQSDRADLHAEAGNLAKASADYQALLPLLPGDGTVRLKLGMVRQRMGQLGEARADYLAALKINPSFALAYNNLAMISLRRNDNPAQAREWAAKAVELQPAVPQFHDTLGQAQRQLGDAGKSVAHFEEAARLGPNQADILFHLAQAYEALGRKADALASYKRALTAQPGFAQAADAKARVALLSS